MSQIKALSNKLKASIRGRTLEYICSGSGKPTIVLINGAGGPLESWYKVYASLEALGTVFAYNRLGIGGSDKPKEPQTGDVIVGTLRALLAQVGLAPPYILVGHSLGGLYANLFARKFPDEVAGVVFLDASAPQDVELMSAQQSTLQRLAEKTLNAIFGKDQFGETIHVAQTVSLIDNAGPFPDVPLIVVSGGKPALAWLTPTKARQMRAENQTALSAMSPRGKQVIAGSSGHFPQFTEPAVVTQAIREVARWPQSKQEQQIGDR